MKPGSRGCQGWAGAREETAVLPAELLRQVAAGEIRPVYLFYGSEPFLWAECLQAIRQAVVEPATEAFNYHIFDGSAGGTGPALAMARTPPFLSARRLVVLRDCPLLAGRAREAGGGEAREGGGAGADPGAAGGAREVAAAVPDAAGAGSGGAGDAGDEGAGTWGARAGRARGEAARPGDDLEAALLAYLQRPVPTTCLVIQLAGEPDRRRKAVRQALELAVAVECRPLKEREAVAWVQERAARQGKAMDLAAAQALVEAVGTDLRTLAGEVEKLCLYVGEAPRVGAGDVAAVAAGSASARLYELTDAVLEGRTADALAALGALVRQGEPALRIVAALANQYRRVAEAAHLRRRGVSPAQAAQTRGYLPFQWERWMRQAARLRPGQVLTALDRLLAADLELKSGGASDQRVLEVLVVDLCRLA